MSNRSGAVQLLIAYLSFVSLGLYDGLLGVAWPSIRQTFGVPLDALGVILAAGTAGFFIVGANSGWITSRLGLGALLVLGNGLRIGGILGIALAPSWWGVAGAALVVGMGTGAHDAGFNTYVALNHSPSRMNWLHACYGIGTTLGPTLLLAAATLGTWQLSYGAIALLQGTLTLYVVLTLGQWRAGPESAAPRPGPTRQTGASHALRLPVVWLGIILFFTFVGVEASAGQWSYTLFTEGRRTAPATAAFWVSLYWGSFTVGRILLGAIADRIETSHLLQGGVLATLAGTILIWWNPQGWVSFAGLTLMGVGIAPLYPGLVAITPGRVGPEHAPHAIGFQVAAASLGFSLIPGLAGVLADNLGLSALPPFLTGMALLVVVLYQASSLIARRPG